MHHKIKVFDDVALLMSQFGFAILKDDISRPWGGFYVIDETQAAAFAKHFFPAEDLKVYKSQRNSALKF